jgi:hypothetical protein
MRQPFFTVVDLREVTSALRFPERSARLSASSASERFSFTSRVEKAMFASTPAMRAGSPRRSRTAI